MEDKKDLILEEKQKQTPAEIETKVTISDDEKVQKAFEDYCKEKYMLWSRKVNLETTAVQEEEQKGFQKYIEKYGEKLYSLWQSNLNTGKELSEEQKQFNNYVKLLQTKGNIKDKFRIVNYEGNEASFESFVNIAKGGRTSQKISIDDANMLKKLFKDSPNPEEQGYVLLYIPDNKINNRTNLTMTIYCKYSGVVGADQITFTGMGYTTGSDNVGGSPVPPPPVPTPVDINRAVVLKAYMSRNYDELVTISTRTNQSIHLENDNQDIYKKIKKDDYVIINFDQGKVIDRPKMSFTLYGRAKGNINLLTTSITIDGLGYSTGIKTYTTDEIDDMIHAPQPPHPQPQPSTGGLIKLPTEDRTQGLDGTGQQSGKYGLNLIDYRYMSRSPQLGVAGQYIKVVEPKLGSNKEIQVRTNGHTIFNKFKHRINDDNSLYLFGGSLGLSGIKKDVTLNFKDKWYDIKKPVDEKGLTGKLKLHIIQEDMKQQGLNPSVHTLEFTKEDDSSTYPNPKQGRYQLELGTDQGELIPSKYMLDFQAWYGDITMKPKGLERNFEFYNYNGHILKANNYIKDEYFEKKLGNVIKRKVGIVRFSDLDWQHSIDIVGEEPHFIYAKVPSDCKVPNGIQDHSGMSTLGGKLMTNNLTEISPEFEHDLNNIPVDKNPPYLQQTITNLPWGDKENPEWCFVLVTSFENAKRYISLLDKTEITYELAEPYQKPIYLQEGGFTITLSNGKILNSYDYKVIKDIKEENAYELTSLDDTTIKISKFQIVDVTPNIN